MFKKLQNTPKIIITCLILFFLFVNSASTVENTLSQKELLKFTNQERKELDLHKLSLNKKLSQIAEKRLKDMQNNNYFAHKNSKKQGLKNFLDQSDYNYFIAGENLAINYQDTEDVMNAWMNSKTHKKNILKPIYRDIGFSYGNVLIDGEERMVIVVIFGRELK